MKATSKSLIAEIEDDVKQPTPVTNSDIAELDKIIADEKRTYNDLSRLKQQRILKRVNKALKRANLKPIKHEDMVKSTEWDGLMGVYDDIVMSVTTTLNTTGKIIESNALPEDIKESDNMGRLRQCYLKLASNLMERILENKKLHTDETGAFITGVVSDDDYDKFMEATATYIDIRQELVREIANLEEPLSTLLGIIKVEAMKEMLNVELGEEDDVAVE